MAAENEGTRGVPHPFALKFGSKFHPHFVRYTLVTTSIGIRVCVSVLDGLEGPLDLPEEEGDTKIFELG